VGLREAGNIIAYSVVCCCLLHYASWPSIIREPKIQARKNIIVDRDETLQKKKQK
jgi:hypothetical protein